MALSEDEIRALFTNSIRTNLSRNRTSFNDSTDARWQALMPQPSVPLIIAVSELVGSEVQPVVFSESVDQLDRLDLTSKRSKNAEFTKSDILSLFSANLNIKVTSCRKLFQDCSKEPVVFERDENFDENLKDELIDGSATMFLVHKQQNMMKATPIVNYISHT